MQKYSTNITVVYTTLAKEFTKHRTPVVELIEMQTNNPFKVLITTILSARTKDQTTAAAVSRLFSKIATPEELSALTIKEIATLIYPVGFYNVKAQHLKALPNALVHKFGGRVPATVNELVTLPGVGRKTANLVVAVAFNKPAVCVDVHVHRIFNRLGYLVTRTPLETEMILRKHLPIAYWTTFNSYFVSFGQNLCKPITPLCGECPIHQWCARKDVR